jgi:alginate O-acetyltransferase complex protein AlgJ
LNLTSLSGSAVAALLVLSCSPVDPRESPTRGEAPGDALPRSALTDRLRGLDRKGLLIGPDGWLFLAEESGLVAPRNRATPTGIDSEEVSIPGDRRRAILELHDQLASAGIELLFLPVPAKLAIYPERLVGGELAGSPVRMDVGAGRFYRELESAGVAVVDLTGAFLARRVPDPDPLYVATDSHWSPRGCVIAAKLLGGLIRERLGRAGPARPDPVSATWIERAGDLTPFLPRRRFPLDRIRLLPVPEPAGKDPADREPDTRVLLIGDSNLVVYSDYRSGLGDHLEREIGEPVTVVAMQAGGANGAREALMRRPELLDARRIVVWVVSSRLLVSGPAWRSVNLDSYRRPTDTADQAQ